MSDNHFLKSVPRTLIREKLQSNKRLVVFVIFIGIATFIWILWSLEKENGYTTIISSPIEFVGIPNNSVLVNELPAKIQIEVTGGGFSLLRHNWDLTKPKLKIDVRNFDDGLLKDEQEKTIIVSLDKIKSKLDSQLPNLQINSFFPDTISIKFARMVSKTIPVLVNLDLELEKQYMIRGKIKIVPDSIEISGPASLLDTLESVYTIPLKLRKVNSDILRNLDLVKTQEKLSYSENRVQVNIPVEQFTEKSLEVPVFGINIPESMNLKLFPSTIMLAFRVVISKFEAVQPENFSLIVDYSNITDGIPSRLTVTIIKSPEYISNIKVNPEDVGYILEKK